MEDIEILADTAVSISELKQNPLAAVKSGHGLPVAVLKHNTPVFYCLTPENYDLILDKLDDLRLAEIIRDRENGETVSVSIDDL